MQVVNAAHTKKLRLQKSMRFETDFKKGVLKMAQKKKSKSTYKPKKRINRSQRIMVVIGVFIIIAMLLPSLLYFFQ